MNQPPLAAFDTGSGHNIGRAIAIDPAARGMRVVVHGHRNRVGAEETAAQLRPNIPTTRRWQATSRRWSGIFRWADWPPRRRLRPCAATCVRECGYISVVRSADALGTIAASA